MIPALTMGGGTMAQDTIYPGVDSVRSATHDEVAIASYFPSPDAQASVSANWSPRLRTALSSITFASVSTASPLRATLARARADVDAHCAGPHASPLLFVAGRGRRGGVSHKAELDAMLRDRVGANGLASLGLAASSSARAALGIGPDRFRLRRYARCARRSATGRPGERCAERCGGLWRRGI